VFENPVFLVHMKFNFDLSSVGFAKWLRVEKFNLFAIIHSFDFLCRDKITKICNRVNKNRESERSHKSDKSHPKKKTKQNWNNKKDSLADKSPTFWLEISWLRMKATHTHSHSFIPHNKGESRFIFLQTT
jgi:hypothetical protein